MIQRLFRRLKQRFRLIRVPSRPVLDLVDFGSTDCVVLDVGANRGGFASNILLRAPLATVHCFEPNEALLPSLRASATKFGRNGPNARCIVAGVAAGEDDGSANLIVTEFAAASSLLAVSTHAREGWPGADFAEQRRVPVEVIRLDNYLDKNGIGSVKLLKLDVQGFELAALKGCSRRLRDVQYVVCEVQFVALYDDAPLWHEIVSFLGSHDFEPVVMDGFCFAPDGRPLQADMLFHNKRMPCR